MLNEWIGNRFHAIDRANRNDCRATTYNQSQLTRIFSHFVRIIRIYIKNNSCSIRYNVIKLLTSQVFGCAIQN